MKKIVLTIMLTLLSLNIFSLTTSGSGYDAGNGGLVLVCYHNERRDFGSWDRVVDRIAFYDLWYWSKEGAVAQGFSYRQDIRDAKVDSDRIIVEFIELYPKYMELVKKEYQWMKKEFQKHFDEYARGISNMRLSNTFDYGDRVKPDWGCRHNDDGKIDLETVAKYSERGYFHLVMPYYFALTEIEKVALIFHETIYRVLDLLGKDNGEAFKTMEITAVMMSNKERVFKKKKFLELFR